LDGPVDKKSSLWGIFQPLNYSFFQVLRRKGHCIFTVCHINQAIPNFLYNLRKKPFQRTGLTEKVNNGKNQQLRGWENCAADICADAK
jgi:hypothetical protein